jgi:hypothetical protein
MAITANNTTLTFNDATTQTTAGVTSIVAGTGISSSGGLTPTIANTGVTSIVAGTGISVNTGTGAVTVTNTATAPNTNQLAKAWVRFNGQSGASIYGSYNVSSVSNLGSGLYQVNFTTAMTNGDYAAASMGEWTTGVSNAGLVCMSRSYPPQTTSLTLAVTGSGGATSLYFYINVVVFSA